MDCRKLHYGDLYAGVAAFQTLVIKNVSKEVLEVILSSDAQGEVSFDVDHESSDAADEGEECPGRDGLPEKEGKFLLLPPLGLNPLFIQGQVPSFPRGC